MKHVSLIIDHSGEVLTQYEAGHLPMIDANRSLRPKRPKDLRTVVFDPDMLGLPVAPYQTAAYSETMLNELDRLQMYMDVRLSVTRWRDVAPDVLSVWAMNYTDTSSEGILRALELPLGVWHIDPGPVWRILQPPKNYPSLTEIQRFTLTKAA